MASPPNADDYASVAEGNIHKLGELSPQRAIAYALLAIDARLKELIGVLQQTDR